MKDHLIPLVKEMLIEGEDDWVMVDFLIGVAEEFASPRGEDFRDVSLELLRELLREEVMEIGDLGHTGFEPWPLGVDDSVARFKEGCESHDWDPMGALWWLANTEKGARWLENIH
ncbi:hypothetical protein DTL70_19880 [Streptomyces diacarni]|uniref:DUF596 domain-containing protein n=1 Tax=Streptomyces diacarni TaxID=2800381 RepID=A0A367ES97_9ACTN|nr:hypothetical protein [Streptomyces diacarni]RCG20572.1 hypothetical protein DTL70_19880 [Streptomyces diacarni]